VFVDIKSLIGAVFPEFDEHIGDKIPTCIELNQGFKANNHNHQTLKFIPQDENMPFVDLPYEERIFQKGLIATRKNNWHDFFNAMVWKAYPHTKSAINATHQAEISRQASTLRSRKRDLLTLFDESGVIVLAEKKVLKLIKNHQWHELFIENKASWLNNSIQIKTFGHAMYEKYLSPYIGMTAQALLIDVNVENLDVYLSENLMQGKLLNSKAELSPLPLLGIPNWHENQDADFYANEYYFR